MLIAVLVLVKEQSKINESFFNHPAELAGQSFPPSIEPAGRVQRGLSAGAENRPF
jgi:hypothetical protein